MLIVLFSVTLGWLPSGGAGTIGSSTSTAGPRSLDKARYMVLPATSLALFYVAIYARLTRAAMLEVRSQDFVRTAYAKGLSPVAVTRAPYPAQRANPHHHDGRHAYRRHAGRRRGGGDRL